MKKLIFSIILSITAIGAILSQDFIEVNNVEIKNNTTDSLSYLYYPILLERFTSFDTTLTQDDYKHLYYGYVYTDMYNPYGEHELTDSFFNLYYNQEYTKAIDVGEKILKDDPVNTTIIFKMLVCNHVLENIEMKLNYVHQYYSLLSIIYNTGDGKSAETAFKVIKVSDEYEILKELGLKSNGQALVGFCDRLDIDQKSQKIEKGQKKIKELYFDVSLPFAYLNNQFSDD